MKKVIDIGEVITEIKKEAEMGFVSIDTVKRVLNEYQEVKEAENDRENCE